MGETIANQAYLQIERKVTSDGQIIVTHNHEMLLYKEQIITDCHTFLIREVYDMSYRKLGKEGGVFYLHTNQGVYPYHVKSDPREFIAAFKEIINK